MSSDLTCVCGAYGYGPDEHSMSCPRWFDLDAELLTLMDQETGAAGSHTAALSVLPAATSASWSWSRGCEHTLSPVELSDGTMLYASDHYSHRKQDQSPDVGFYLDRIWLSHVEHFAYVIGWQDFGLPTPTANVVLRYARQALKHSREGEMVEIACLGSHGRTGTFLAICELLTMETPDAGQAIRNIRKQHCYKAVETAEQEWYVAAIAALLTDQDIPMHPEEIAALRKQEAAKKEAKNIRKGKRGNKRKR